MGTAVEMTSDFYTVPDHPALAMLANRRNRLNCTFEAVECMLLTGGDQLESFIVLVAADFALGHNFLHGHR
jgi:hypothetical protein